MEYQIKTKLPKIPRWELVFWQAARIILALCALYSFFIDFNIILALESVFGLIFTYLWNLFQIFGNGSFIEDVPPGSQTMLTGIILGGIVCGSYFQLFRRIPCFDLVMHTVSGVVSAVFGFDFACIIQGKKHKTSPTLAALFALCFGLSIAVGWEFYEFLMDTFHGTDLQLGSLGGRAGLADTMTDMMANTVGALAGTAAVTARRVWRQRHGGRAFFRFKNR